MAERTPVINKIFERDIDLLLVEELRCNKDFLSIFLQKAGWTEEYLSVETFHSVYMDYGEADVEVILSYPDGTCRALLIEDKVDATTQKRQSQRYTENAEQLLKEKSFTALKTFLVAPQKYINDHKKDHNIADFKTQITYEELIEFFEKPLCDARALYKADLLRFAIGKQKRQNAKLVDPQITEFWRKLRERTRYYPKLEFINKTEEKTKNDEYWASWYSPIKGATIYWKANHGYIDVQVEKCADRETEFRRRFQKKLLPGMRIEKAGGSVVFRMENERCWKMSFSERFEDNVQRVDHVLSYVDCVYRFMESLPEDVFAKKELE